ncbi:MAG: hypothetical protein M3509_03535, partial [Chloroflexota bacterium]|nr:hypothetical protein [Chloroflexota bacterium]
LVGVSRRGEHLGHGGWPGQGPSVGPGGGEGVGPQLLLERERPSVCWEHPGFEIDLVVTADTLTLHRVYLGYQSLANALQHGQVMLDGPRRWFAPSRIGLRSACLPRCGRRRPMPTGCQRARAAVFAERTTAL